jgi:hypothetical protein
MKMIPKVLFAAIGLASFGVAPASSTTLIGQTINADITITGSDDNGSYSLVVLNGPVSIPGPGDFTDTIPVFKQLTLGGSLRLRTRSTETSTSTYRQIRFR